MTMWDMPSIQVDINWNYIRQEMEIEQNHHSPKNSREKNRKTRYVKGAEMVILSNFSPQKDQRGNCTALYLLSLYEFSWIHIPCNEPLIDKRFLGLPWFAYICEKRLNKSTETLLSRALPKVHCENASILFLSFCLKFQTLKPEEISTSPIHSQENKSKDDLFVLFNSFLEHEYFNTLLTKFFEDDVFVLSCLEEINTPFTQPDQHKTEMGVFTKTSNLLLFDIYKWNYKSWTSVDFPQKQGGLSGK